MALISSIDSGLQKIIFWFRSDGRHFQIISQLTLLCYGIFYLSWDSDYLNFVAAFSGCLIVQLLAIRFAGLPSHSIKSALITSLGLCLLLKTNSPIIFFLAGWFAIGQKILLKISGKHLWNPANFGIVLVILVSGDAWISPGQWGSGALLVLLIGALGLSVLSRIKRMETGLVFISVLFALEYCRSILYLGWDWDLLLHKMSSGSLWLFTLFMITDPMTNPNGKWARIIWAGSVACLSFYLANFHFVNGAPFWALFFATPVNIILDYFIKRPAFQWKTASQK
jgi:Na+-transporting NADH:ubiquinone oxidoreductase subunit NqrB